MLPGDRQAASRVQALDLLRLVAVVAVILYHYGFWGPSSHDVPQVALPWMAGFAQYGFLGVPLFFIISGFVIAGGATENLLVRGVGPGLASFGVTGALADPQVGLYDSAGRLVTANDNWSGATLATTATGVGAFALTTGSKDAALTTTLAPGAYTAQVSG
eukprot:gene51197-biopygen36117